MEINKKRIILLLIAVALLFFPVQSQTDEVKFLDDGSVVHENSDYYLKADLNNIGYSPIDELYHLDWEVMSKGQDRTLDYAFISPVRLQGKSKAIIKWKEPEQYKIEHKYFCDSSEYGLINSSTAWCYFYWNESENNASHWYNSTINFNPDERLFITNPTNATIIWNTTHTKIVEKILDITDSFNYINVDTLENNYPSFINWDKVRKYGNYTYILLNKNLLSDTKYDINFVLEVNKSLLPIKYTMAFLNRDTDTLFVLDPTIVDSRTWTTTTDFTNGTILKNVSTSGDEVKLSDATTKNTLQTFYSFYNDANDLYGSANAGTTGDPTFGSANAVTNLNNSVYLDGTGDCIQPPSSTFSMNSSGKIYMRFWFKQDTVSSGARFYRMDSSGAGYIHGIERSDLGANTIRFQIKDDDADIVQLDITNSKFGDGSWHLFELVKNGTTQADTYYFLDNEQIAQGSGTDDISSTTYDDDTDLFCDSGGGENEIYVSDFAYFNVPPSQSERTAYYNGGNGLAWDWKNSQGRLEDRQQWTPQTNNEFKNISVVYSADTGSASFCYDTDNTTLSTCTALSDGTNNIDLNLGADTPIYYNFNFSGTGSGAVTSYTLYEESAGAPPSCSIDSFQFITLSGNHTNSTTKTYQFELNITNDCELNISIDPTSWCYQESANVSTGCGGLSTGNYAWTNEANWDDEKNISDGDWTTTFVLNAQWEIYHYYVNYSKPNLAQSGRLKIKDYDGSERLINVTISDDCFNQNPIQLDFKWETGFGAQNTYYCYNGTGWEDIGSNTAGNYYELYEEAMWWKLTNMTKGLIPENSGTPFYTTDSNPLLINLSTGSYLINWTVNATGEIGETYEFFGNVTEYDNATNKLGSNKINITITSPAVANSCTYGGSGTWNIDCSDNCGISNQDALGNNVILDGTGTITGLRNITNTPLIRLQNGCIGRW